MAELVICITFYLKRPLKRFSSWHCQYNKIMKQKLFKQQCSGKRENVKIFVPWKHSIFYKLLENNQTQNCPSRVKYIGYFMIGI